jgi:hypothetical protein
MDTRLIGLLATVAALALGSSPVAARVFHWGDSLA